MRHRSLEVMKLAAIVSGVLLIAGCGSESYSLPLDFSTGGAGFGGEAGSAGQGDSGAVDAASTSCVDGATRSCSITLPSQGGIKNCFVGTEQCKNGKWGPCAELVLTDAGSP
jgi:hypothetical protein